MKRETLIKRHTSRTARMARDFAKILAEDCAHIISSGAVDMAAWPADDYRLAKVVLNAAIKRNAGAYRPLSADLAAESKALEEA